MAGLGHSRYAVAGIDLGMVTGYALAASHRERVTRLAVVEAILPGLSPLPNLLADATTNEFLWHSYALVHPTPAQVGAPDRRRSLSARRGLRRHARSPGAAFPGRRNSSHTLARQARCQATVTRLHIWAPVDI
jgi:pimeloyl-ACP methyl ester carboxylesterase